MIPAHERPSSPAATALADRISSAIPTLRTERLVLRPPRLSDFDVLADILSSERSRFVGGPMSRKKAWTEFTQITSGWLLHGHGSWTIEREGAIAGFVLVSVEPGDHEREVGYILTEDAEGKGVATEAAEAARAFAFSTLKFETLVSYIGVGNERSARVAEKLGGRRDPEAEAKMKGDVMVYRYRNQEAES
ncbi:MAG: GNAT family N-acetyltransferase [Paracoccaceae bacterium]|nr:GNAT family N-acetyltransferase [Paracoccaceae bacterium]